MPMDMRCTRAFSSQVDDLFTSDAIPLVLREVEEFEVMMRRLSTEEVLYIYGGSLIASSKALLAKRSTVCSEELLFV